MGRTLKDGEASEGKAHLGSYKEYYKRFDEFEEAISLKQEYEEEILETTEDQKEIKEMLKKLKG